MFSSADVEGFYKLFCIAPLWALTPERDFNPLLARALRVGDHFAGHFCTERLTGVASPSIL